MQIKFNNAYLELLFQGLDIGKPKYSAEVIKKFKKTIQIIQYVVSVNDLYNFKGLHFEKLLNGYYSVRVDRKYRLEFVIEKDELTIQDIVVIEELSNHYGDN
jgi:plasmid maintenance system killer protein